MSGLASWDFNNSHVQSGISGGKFIGAHSTLIAAGPPRLSQAGAAGSAYASAETFKDLGGTIATQDPMGSPSKSDAAAVFAWPIGVCENVGIGQNKQLTRLYEIGSRRCYFIVGRNVVNLSLARTMYDGPNLLRALYAYYPKEFLSTAAEKASAAAILRTAGTFRQLNRTVGYGDFWINLDSDLFDNPFGLFLMFFDSVKEPYGAMFVEDCHIQNHQFGISSQANLVGEGVTVQGDSVVPVNIGAKNFTESFVDPYARS